MKAEGGRRQSGIPTPGLGPSSISLVVVTHPKRYGITLPGHIALRWGSSLGGIWWGLSMTSGVHMWCFKP